MKLHPLLAVVLLVGSALPTHAALITWGAPTTISGDADVDLSGTLVGALNLSSNNLLSPTINGVTFTALGVANNTTNTASSGPFTLATSSGNIGATIGLGSGSAPFSTLSAPYRNLLMSAMGAAAAGATLTLTISSLTVGQSYEFQWWSNRSATTNFLTTANGGGGTVTLSSNPGGLAGGVGQFAIGTFTADATTQSIAFTSPTATFVNGFQLRQLAPTPAVPEPGTALAGMVLVGLCATMRRRRKDSLASR